MGKHADSKYWRRCRRRNKSSIGRLTHPSRLRGPILFENVALSSKRLYKLSWPVNDIMYPTCRAACEALGLLEDDQEWETTLQEAALTVTPAELRTLLVYILSFCQLESCLNHCSKSLTDFGLRLLPEHLKSVLRKLLMEEKSYGRALLAKERDRLLSKLNVKQRHILSLITEACLNNKQELVFVYSHGGTGKTFLWKTIIYALRSGGRIVTIASSGKKLDVGNGHIDMQDESDLENTSWINIPDDYCIPDDKNGISNLIKFIYDDETLHNPAAVKLQDKAIVCPKHNMADVINAKVLFMLLGRTHTYISFDDAIPHGYDGVEVELLYPKDYLSSLSYAGLPPHKLDLKIGTPIMLLRNINFAGGLCNGTRLIVKQLLPKVIEAQIIMGTMVSQKVFLPRIPLTTKDPRTPFIFKRKQFSMKVCYAMTVNKLQGQSLKKIGVYLSEPVFGNSHLYVTLSRATTPDGLKVLISSRRNRPPTATKNIVSKTYFRNMNLHRNMATTSNINKAREDKGLDFCIAVKWFFDHGVFAIGCNSSFVALIPKVFDPKVVSDYRPISLIGSLYKVVTKILATLWQKWH
ncbi:DNA helicase [Tanacetum coccineum]